MPGGRLQLVPKATWSSAFSPARGHSQSPAGQPEAEWVQLVDVGFSQSVFTAVCKGVCVPKSLPSFPAFLLTTRRLREEKIPCGVRTPKEGPLLEAASGAASPGHPETLDPAFWMGPVGLPPLPQLQTHLHLDCTRRLPEGLTVLTKMLTYLPACPVLRCPRSLTLWRSKQTKHNGKADRPHGCSRHRVHGEAGMTVRGTGTYTGMPTGPALGPAGGVRGLWGSAQDTSIGE
ncbi:uncharacterized protein LOC125108475 isoform X2 [Lutra lutra]|uniref:uncharacterized protein LOC125108475 isoform X2 n=1 Tax=Lutra lutra TaxID=9657 RepID=UPI001FD3FDD5|nr:uncharacterized protein LOC125108475 isoform X2 [Lutra lutra]